MRVKLMVAGCALLVALLAATPVGADRYVERDIEQQDQGDVILTVGEDGSVTQPSGGASGGTLVCQLFAHAPSFEAPTDNPPLATSDLVVDGYYWLTCDDTATDPPVQVVARIFQYVPGETIIGPDELARRARGQLAILYPEPQTSPGHGIDQIVGIETWLWIDDAAWQPISASASIPGLSVTATATPRQVTWDMGDGTTVTCDGPGTVYDPSRSPADQSTDCGHVYQRRGAHTAAATITWMVEWSASDGSGGPLTDVSRTTQFPMTVVERQAVGR